MQVSLLLARMVTVARMMMAVKILAMGGKGEDGKNALKAERARLALNQVDPHSSTLILFLSSILNFNKLYQHETVQICILSFREFPFFVIWQIFVFHIGGKSLSTWKDL